MTPPVGEEPREDLMQAIIRAREALHQLAGAYASATGEPLTMEDRGSLELISNQLTSLATVTLSLARSDPTHRSVTVDAVSEESRRREPEPEAQPATSGESSNESPSEPAGGGGVGDRDWGDSPGGTGEESWGWTGGGGAGDRDWGESGGGVGDRNW